VQETLQVIEGPVDFLLLDIWTPLACPVMKLVTKHLRRGAIVITDNTSKRRQDYHELLEFIAEPAHGFATQTLPFDGGLEMSVKL
jgi:predicted O-methyltransferase YrrM